MSNPMLAGLVRSVMFGPVLAAACAVVPSAAQALTIDATYDSSVTSSSQASQIESAFNSAASVFDAALTAKVTVNIDVGWGEIDGSALGSGALGESQTYLVGTLSYASAVSVLKNAVTGAFGTVEAANFPKSVAAGNSFYLTLANAQALGLEPANAGLDGYIGFGSSFKYTFNPSSGVAAGTYDFLSVAEHEISEVLGRISGVGTSYPMLLDLFRYSAAGVSSYNYNTAAYFSIDGGTTNLGNYNVSSSGGDRGDWSGSGSTANDAADAFANSGVVEPFSAADWTELSAIGWNSNPADVGTITLASGKVLAGDNVPEPASLAVLASGMLGLGALRRGRRATCPGGRTIAPGV